MRLLHFDSSGKLNLTDFRGKSIPPYAIRSHRWGCEEVLFEDVRDRSYERKTSYEKIGFCAKQATQDYLEYFWIDTCCIDKWNVDELSKAINSMYNWYRDAARCYVFLPDVSICITTSVQCEETWKESFRKSKWFTREWTLQELIAPKMVEFFPRWSSTRRQRVAGLALHGDPLESFSIPERMAWAKFRETTEPEDGAYCLSGILHVSIPKIYGEGMDTALEKLRNELKPAGIAPFSIPFSRNPKSVGRELQLADLAARLFQNKQTIVIAVTGAGGAGKSQLAPELAYITKEKDEGCSAFWIDAGDINNADVRLLVTDYLSREESRKWLLIFDNADDVGLTSADRSIILTTTNNDTAETFAKVSIIQLKAMTPSAAESMLEKYLTTPIPSGEREEMKLLLEEHSYLPLAIVLVAVYIRLNNITLSDYRLSRTLPKHGQQQDRTMTSIDTTLLISLQHILSTYPLAAESLLLSACIGRKDIPRDFFTAASDYALVTRRPAESAPDVHRLVHHAIRNWLQEQQ
ncbi:HET-domain-containing protein [Polychaeton citri CBS 116435]|uniref:HET-domain-containing protein n=1 Tax=Polychaeton citri CBS 116435 TaxID=1314669 RepID=A0A9P4QGV8_9PEZI|nr:HET-domain-containing protein [Polychaeton citri CBS 116435]